MKEFKACPNCGNKWSGVGVPNIHIPVYKCKKCGKVYCHKCSKLLDGICPNQKNGPLEHGQFHPRKKIGEYVK